MMEGYLDDCVVISNGGVSNNNFYRMINQKNNAFNNWNFCCKSGNVIMSSTLTTMSYLFCRCWWLWSQTMLTYKLISFIQNFILFDFFSVGNKMSKWIVIVCRERHTCNVQGDIQKYSFHMPSECIRRLKILFLLLLLPL